MKSAILLLLVGASCALAAPSLESHKAAFEDFKLAHGKQYSNVDEELERFEIFSRNLNEIQKFNEEKSAKVGYTRGVNRFTDMKASETQHLLGLKIPTESVLKAYTNDDFINSYINRQGPVSSEVDWRKVPGTVSEVKDQIDCGSCWAFATTGVLEGQENKNGTWKKLNVLSEQELVDCSKSNSGCHGGLMVAAIDDIKELGGIETEADYPYESEDGECRFDKKKSVLTVKGGVMSEGISEEDLAKLVQNYGPVAIGIHVSESFFYYLSGVFYDDECSSKLKAANHAVLIVGFGSNKESRDYWIIKNSWGDEWGENGYIRMARNRNNMCGITNMATIAEL